ncbi:polysaccharide biosynthesis/export family protein [Alloyangia pacifica]|uniref:polysaccharide biosynthesis/export family protein n=1 Tax=Alloyangia pacifica TaxID=311180 RepID=UPI001CD1B60A|nr:polysaccharide biosynthesis/export family protein [Alloyangia pacifica]MCA0995926.1 polysaccharide biosynthesis/export family protein [Alloyangia pacifica]
MAFFLRHLTAGLTSALILAAALISAGSPAAAEAEDYKVDVGDRLTISVYGKPELSGTFQVRADGNVALHLLGPVTVAGLTMREIEERIETEARERFSSRESVLVDMQEYRDVFVLGAVDTPGAYEYRPGLTVMKAVAMAGGFERLQEEMSSDREIQNARNTVAEAKSRLNFAQSERDALARELARLDGGDAPAGVGEGSALDQEQEHLVGLRRSLLEDLKQGATLKSSLADEEAGMLDQRRALILERLEATQEQLEGMQELESRGLARKEQTLGLKIDLSEYNADLLEIAAFVSRAKQTRANAESDIQEAQTEYRLKLLQDKLEADQRVALEQTDLEMALDYLRRASPAAAADLGTAVETVYEVFRGGSDTAERVSPTATLAPEDVLMISFEPVLNNG